MTKLQPHQKMIVSVILVTILLVFSALTIYVEDVSAQENYPPIIWIQAHNFDDGWGMACNKGCDAYSELGNEQELNMRFPDAWMVINWYFYLFNRKYCGPSYVCLEPLPAPMTGN